MPKTVAVVNSSDDTVEMLRVAFENEGLHTVTGHISDIKRGKTNFLELMQEYDPAVVLYDIAMPYKENWVFLQMLLDTDVAKGRKFLITTTTRAALQEAAGPAIQAFELSEKPYDMKDARRFVQTDGWDRSQ